MLRYPCGLKQATVSNEAGTQRAFEASDPFWEYQMAWVNPFGGGNFGDKQWVDHISSTLKQQLAIKDSTPPVSIFQIPKPLKDEKLEAVNHLLDYMYHSIMNNETSISTEVYFTKPGSGPSEKQDEPELLEMFIQLLEQIPVTKPFIPIIESFKKSFLESIETRATAEEIKVPSVSELRDIAGVKFHLSPSNSGIRNIKFELEKERCCYLPVITLNIDSEVILRNLVAD
ncbi:hypothetical protein L2E82_30140 [Cichorium intybus]|uniref:Uncharacterized protein n=1 Tax=Cichorium intybus TaxID=13427 RepID=A0ACB9CZJ6_CICIN|nr:hypothetical protein L2E82_30140 [Cichorium intybus]